MTVPSTPPDRPPILYQATANQLGLLGPKLAERIAAFYRKEMKSQDNLKVLGDGRYMEFGEPDKEFFLERSIKLEDEIIKAGNHIVRLLEENYDLN